MLKTLFVPRGQFWRSDLSARNIKIQCRSPVSPMWMLQEHEQVQMWANPFRWSLLKMLTVCCTSVSVVHWFPQAEQLTIGGLIKPPRPQLVALLVLQMRSQRSQIRCWLRPLMHHLVLIAPFSNTSEAYISWHHVCGLVCLTTDNDQPVTGVIFQPYCKHMRSTLLLVD